MLKKYKTLVLPWSSYSEIKSPFFLTCTTIFDWQSMIISILFYKKVGNTQKMVQKTAQTEESVRNKILDLIFTQSNISLETNYIMKAFELPE